MSNALTPIDLVAYGELPSDLRLEVDAWRDRCDAATKPIRQWARDVAASLGVGVSTVLRKYYAYVDQGWKGLVDRAQAKEWTAKWIDGRVQEAEASDEFIEWFKKLADQNQRKIRPAWRKFAALWQRGAQIPGLDNSLPRNELPPGCSYARLIVRIADKFRREAMTVGLSSAVGKYGPQVFTTRAGLWVGSHLMIDDLWHDNFVVFKGKMVRVLELDALDVFSGCKVAWGCKPRFQREDGTFDNLKEKYARLIVAQNFWQNGFSNRGTWILAEHGTAAISERVARILHDRSGGLITLRESGMTGEEQAIAGWYGQSKGNFRFKAALESLRNLIHNELGDAPGQTGMDVAHRPEYLHGTLKGCEDLLKAIAVLMRDKPERAALIKLPLLEYHSQFLPLLAETYQRINARTWHALEGWHEAGNMVIEYRCSPQSAEWLLPESFNELPEAIRNGVLQAAQNDARYLQQRALSPSEVYRRGCGELQRMPAFVVGELLGDDYAQEREVEGAYFKEFFDQEIAPGPLLFESVIETPTGEREQLRDGKYLTFVNPFDAAQMFVHDAKGRCLGIAARVRRVNPVDEAALRSAFGNRNRRLAEMLKPIRAAHAESLREQTAHTQAVIDAIQSPAERAAARAVQRVDVAEELLKRPVVETLRTVDQNDW
jgi:hypothetical protein